MDKPSYVYVTYIKTTPDKLWTALTSADFTEKYWPGGGGGRIQSDWKVGSLVSHSTKKGAWQGEVLRVEPPRLLSYTMQAPGPKEEHPSHVVFELEPLGPVVKLTVSHYGLNEEGVKAVGKGWPQILSSLKSLLEVGSALPYERWD
jgi:uncharacterized protein YndB with AHSA1/START domain